MPPPTEIKGLDPRFFRPCIFPTLGRFGYGTRVTVNNGVGPESPFATEMTVSMSAYDSSGAKLGSTGELTRLEPGGIDKLEIDDVLGDIPGGDQDDVLCILHVTPVEMAGKASVDVPTKSTMAHVRVSDDFIEFHQKPKGVVTGVAYQTGPLNDRRLSSTRTTVCQAPKVIVSDSVDTLFCLLNVSTQQGYDETVRMDFWLLGPDGTRIARSYVEVPPFSFRLVSATQVLEQAGKLDEFRERGALGMFLGLSKNGTLVPISLTRNRDSGAIACDHTLPPPFYVTTWGGEKRLEANERLEREFFSNPAEVPAEPVDTSAKAVQR